MGSLFEKWKKGLKKKVHPFCTAIVPAAGKSSRMGGEDKMFAPLCGVPVLARTLTVLDQAVLVDEIVVAAQPEKLEEVAALVSSAGIRKPVRVVEGGASRAESVLLAALEANEDVEYLAVHDGARPLVLPEQVDDLIRLGQRTYAVAPAVPVTDTVKVADLSGLVLSTPDRSTLFAVQTPQVFQANLLKAALQSAIAAEVLTVPRSAIGRMIYESKLYLQTTDLFAWTLAVILLSVGLERLVLRALTPRGKGGGGT